MFSITSCSQSPINENVNNNQEEENNNEDNNNNDNESNGDSNNEEEIPSEENELELKLEINDYVFMVDLEDNEADHELLGMVKEEPLELNLRDYGGFEKVGSLGKNLTRNDTRITTKPGDIVLYQGNQIVMFYGSNTWSYTMLGHVSDLTNWSEALDDNDINVLLSIPN